MLEMSTPMYVLHILNHFTVDLVNKLDMLDASVVGFFWAVICFICFEHFLATLQRINSSNAYSLFAHCLNLRFMSKRVTLRRVLSFLPFINLFFFCPPPHLTTYLFPWLVLPRSPWMKTVPWRRKMTGWLKMRMKLISSMMTPLELEQLVRDAQTLHKY